MTLVRAESGRLTMIHRAAMKRDPRLRGLSSEHHDALVLVRRIRREPASCDVAAACAALAAHFLLEERVLLPALAAAGRTDLAKRTAAEHEAIRAAVTTPLRFADLLEAHVRFEERELFPVCEALIPESLDALG